MRVHLIKKQTIIDYVNENPRSKTGFHIWLNVIKYGDWIEPSSIIKTFRSADLLGRGSNRVIFNIGGNKYRVICSYYFGIEHVHLFIKWIGTHAEYDTICKTNLQYKIDNYSK